MLAYYLQVSRPDRLDRVRSVLDALAPSEGVVVSPDAAPGRWRGEWVSLDSTDPEVWRNWVTAHRPESVIVEGSGQHVSAATGVARSVAVMASPGEDRAGEGADLVLAPWAGEPHDGPSAPGRVLHLGALGSVARAAVTRRSRRAGTGHRWSCVRLVPTAAGPAPRERRSLAAETPEWRWAIANERDVLHDGPTWDQLLQADVVVCAPTAANIAAVAAVRVPTVLVTRERPSPSEAFLAERARQTAPVVVLPESSANRRWRLVLNEARELDGAGWEAWDPKPGLDRLVGALGLDVRQTSNASIPHPRTNLTDLTPA